MNKIKSVLICVLLSITVSGCGDSNAEAVTVSDDVDDVNEFNVSQMVTESAAAALSTMTTELPTLYETSTVTEADMRSGAQQMYK